MDRRKRYLQRRNQDCIVSLRNSNGGVRRKNQFSICRKQFSGKSRFSFHKREIDSATSSVVADGFCQDKTLLFARFLNKIDFFKLCCLQLSVLEFRLNGNFSTKDLSINMSINVQIYSFFVKKCHFCLEISKSKNIV